jgi:hypothetical protein
MDPAHRPFVDRHLAERIGRRSQLQQCLTLRVLAGVAVIQAPKGEHEKPSLCRLVANGVLDDGEDAWDIELGGNRAELADRSARSDIHFNCVEAIRGGSLDLSRKR